MKPEEIKAFLIAHGYTQDQWGHMKKEFSNKIRRYKFQKISVRIETRKKVPNSHWLNEAYGKTLYYKNLEIIDNKITLVK